MNDYLQYLPINLTTFIIINLILSTVVILLERKNPTGALAWLFFLNLLPGIGFFFYVLLAQNISKRKIFRYTQEEANLYQKILRDQRRSIIYGDFTFTSSTAEKHKDIILFHNKLSSALYSQNNSVNIFTHGRDKFKSLFQDIEAAKYHVHVLYYIIKNDELSNKLFDLLIKKAQAGLEVRLLIDHVGGRSIPNKRINELKNAGVYTAFFFPSKTKYINFRTNYRNHRKIVIIDGAIGYIGGFNVGDEYLGKDKKFGNWRDTHLRLVGDSVLSLQTRFILDWRNASKKYLDINAPYMQDVISDSNVGIQIVDSGPDDQNEQIKQGYLQMIHRAEKYIFLQSPYFIPDDSIIEGLKIAAAKGLDVRIMIPNKPDHPFVYWATYSYCGDLIPYGVKIYTYENGFLHAKTIIVDDEVASVGTCNFDIRSFKLNFEVNAFIYDNIETTHLRHIFEEDIMYSRELSAERYAKRSIVIKIKEAISRLFSPVL